MFDQCYMLRRNNSMSLNETIQNTIKLKLHTSTTDGKVSEDAGDVFCTPKNKETFYRQLNILKYIRTCHRVSRLRSAVITNRMYGNITRNWPLNDERSIVLDNNRPICNEQAPNRTHHGNTTEPTACFVLM